MGTATVASAVTTGAQSGLWQVAVVWGFAVALGIYLSVHVSSAHLNPAVTLALAVSKRTQFPWSKVLPYITAQLAGAMFSGVCVLVLYGTAISRYEHVHKITRGDANSSLSAMVFGEYFPNPQLVKSGDLFPDDVSPFLALVAEAFGTMILMIMIRVLTDNANGARPSGAQVPFYIGFTVAVVISFTAPLTQAGLNPARDLGPRIIAALAGWSSVALPGPRNGFWVYIIGPIGGAQLATIVYDILVAPTYVAVVQVETPTGHGELELGKETHIPGQSSPTISHRSDDLRAPLVSPMS